MNSIQWLRSAARECRDEDRPAAAAKYEEIIAEIEQLRAAFREYFQAVDTWCDDTEEREEAHARAKMIIYSWPVTTKDTRSDCNHWWHEDGGDTENCPNCDENWRLSDKDKEQKRWRPRWDDDGSGDGCELDGWKTP